MGGDVSGDQDLRGQVGAVPDGDTRYCDRMGTADSGRGRGHAPRPGEHAVPNVARTSCREFHLAHRCAGAVGGDHRRHQRRSGERPRFGGCAVKDRTWEVSRFQGVVRRPGSQCASRHVGVGDLAPARKDNRADVFVVNGIPVAIVEHKDPKRPQRLAALTKSCHPAPALREGRTWLVAQAQLHNETHLIDYGSASPGTRNRKMLFRKQ